MLPFETLSGNNKVNKRILLFRDIFSCLVKLKFSGPIGCHNISSASVGFDGRSRKFPVGGYIPNGELPDSAPAPYHNAWPAGVLGFADGNIAPGLKGVPRKSFNTVPRARL
jgi:hypothetical protein